VVERRHEGAARRVEAKDDGKPELELGCMVLLILFSPRWEVAGICASSKPVVVSAAGRWRDSASGTR